jgi:creatinine amidohydrolase
MTLKLNWHENRFCDFSGADLANTIAVLPVAATEQHGSHLPLGTDTFIMEGYLARVKAQLPQTGNVIFLPTQTIGQSREHIAFAGTLTLRTETALQSWLELGESIALTGIKKLIIINSHGGNSSIIDLVSRELRIRHKMLAVIASWSRFGYPDGLFSPQEITHGIHGGDIETSLMLSFRPDLVRCDEMKNFIPATIEMERKFKQLNATRPAGFGWMAQDLHPSGTMGDASLATAVKGERATDFGTKAFLELLDDVRELDIERFARED